MKRVSGKTFVKTAIEQYNKRLHLYLKRRLRYSALEPDDVMQEAYLRLLRVDDTRLIKQPEAYLFKIVTNVVYEMEIKEQKSPTTTDGQIDPELLSSDSASDIDRVEQQDSLMAMLKRLPSMQQAVLLMHKRDGRSYKEISEKLGLTTNTVKKYLFLALTNCRKHGWK